MYRERRSRLDGVTVWRRLGPAPPGELRILPDGCMDLIWSDGELMIAGPDTTAYVSTAPAAEEYAAVRFAPGLGPTVLGVPARDLLDRRVRLSEIWPAALVRRLTERIETAPDRAAAVEDIVGDRLADRGWADPTIAGLVARLDAGFGVARTAAELGIGERRLHRRCLDAFGYGPKTLGRILRLNRALELARAGSPFAEVAVVAGYADQAHLAREVKGLAGVPMGALVR